MAADSPWTGIPSLHVQRTSQASATQRAGRAGRTGPGRVIRLYTAEDFHRRPNADTPEILRRELSQIALQLRAMGITQLEWLDAPPPAALAAANSLLDKLAITSAMADLPLPPRLAKLVTEAARRGVPEKGYAVAAVLSAGERGSEDLMTLVESEWQPQTRKILEQLRRKWWADPGPQTALAEPGAGRGRPARTRGPPHRRLRRCHPPIRAGGVPGSCSAAPPRRRPAALLRRICASPWLPLRVSHRHRRGRSPGSRRAVGAPCSAD